MDNLEIDLAQTAFKIYDNAGEAAMLSFLIQNEILSEPGAHLPAGREYNLRDGSKIRHLGDQAAHYQAVLRDKQKPTRPALIPASKQPGAIDLSTPILNYPTKTDIVRALLAIAESEARAELGLIADEDLLELYDAVTTLPDLENALHKAVELQKDRPIPGRRIDSYMDAVVETCASDAFQMLPEGQRDALLELAKEELEKVGVPGALF